jgi:hypothetical protein
VYTAFQENRHISYMIRYFVINLIPTFTTLKKRRVLISNSKTEIKTGTTS